MIEPCGKAVFDWYEGYDSGFAGMRQHGADEEQYLAMHPAGRPGLPARSDERAMQCLYVL